MCTDFLCDHFSKLPLYVSLPSLSSMFTFTSNLHIGIIIKSPPKKSTHKHVGIIIFRKSPTNRRQNHRQRTSSTTTTNAKDFEKETDRQLLKDFGLWNQILSGTWFLYEDLPHLFDEQGIDRTAYDEEVRFRDPITKHDTISGYLFNISLLKILFEPNFQLHWVRQTGPYDITTRWTMVMKFALLPWKPELIFTGTSVMSVNPKTGKFCSHVDYWDSIDNNEYFSLEGLSDVAKQLRYFKTPALESPKYDILKRTATYEVRKYAPFIVVETTGNKLSGSTGFNDVAGYIFGKNSKTEKIKMTTPVFTQASDPDASKVSIQIVLPLDKDISSLPDPTQEGLELRKVEGGIAAVSKFSGKPVEELVREKEKALRSSLIKDGLKPESGCMLARYNDPRTWAFTMRNEVLIWLKEFNLE